MNAWLAIGLVLLALGLLIAGVRLLQGITGIAPEGSRKIVHIGMGLLTLSFPWLFNDYWPVILLAALAVVMLSVLRRVSGLASWYSVLGGVARTSLGEIYFPVSVAVIFCWSGGNAVLYLVPILILTLADAVGALVGIRYGSLKYTTDEGHKTAEGSLAFFVTAFLSAHVPLLLLTDAGRAESLLIGLTLGFLIMLTEAASWEGLDNLFVPLTSFLLLDRYLNLEAGELLVRFLVAALLVIFVLVWRSRTTLSHSAAIGGAFFGYIIWSLGGWQWMVAPVIFFLTYAWVVPLQGEKQLARDIHAVIRVLSGPLIYLAASRVYEQAGFLYLSHVTLACHLANVIISRLHQAECKKTKILLLATFLPTALIMLPWWLLTISKVSLIWAILAIIPIALCGWIFFHTIHQADYRRHQLIVWLREGALAPAVALLGMIPMILIPYEM